MWIGLILVVALTTGGGLVYGRLTNRWGATQIQSEAGAKLERIPTNFATWKGGESTHLPDYAQAQLECTGEVIRQYVDAETGSTIGVTLLVGPAGTLAVHSPEICFPSQNYRLLGKRQRVEVQDVKGVDHSFWAVDFQLQNVEGEMVRVYYAWSTGGAWSAPDDPRFAFAGSAFLYKIQLVAPVVSTALDQTQDATQLFLRAFLPEASEELVSSSSSR